MCNEWRKIADLSLRNATTNLRLNTHGLPLLDLQADSHARVRNEGAPLLPPR